MMAASRLRSKENYGTTSAEDLGNITKDHLVDHSRVTNTEVTNTVVRQSLPQHSIEGGHKTAHFFAQSHSNVVKHPRTAQLTVFYVGMVNVYDDVPLEKTEAIMVLAGRARPCGASSNDTNLLSGSYATECDVPASIAMKQPVSRAESPSQLTTKPECVPNVQRLKTIATKVELSQARKASLARFLERRKDRTLHLNNTIELHYTQLLIAVSPNLVCFAISIQKELMENEHLLTSSCVVDEVVLLDYFPVIVFDTSFPQENTSIVVNTFC